MLRQLPTGLYGWLSRIVKENENEMDALHAIVPNALPNYVKGLDGQLRTGSPPQITEPDTLGFMVRPLIFHLSSSVDDSHSARACVSCISLTGCFILICWSCVAHSHRSHFMSPVSFPGCWW